MSEVILHSMEELPDGYEYYSRCELDSYDVRPLQAEGIDEAWYWYGTGSYEGAGQILMRKGDMFDLFDMGHCSCSGPTEHYGSFKGNTLSAIEESLSYYYRKAVEPLLKMAKEGA